TNADPDGHYAIDPDAGEGRLPLDRRPNHNPRRYRHNHYYESPRRPHHRGSPAFTISSASSNGCGSDLWCNMALDNQIADVQARMTQQINGAMQDSGHCTSRDCFDDYKKAIDSGAYNWVDIGDGNYKTPDGHVLVTLTDNN